MDKTGRYYTRSRRGPHNPTRSSARSRADARTECEEIGALDAPLNELNELADLVALTAIRCVLLALVGTVKTGL